MTSCGAAFGTLSAYVDGELNASAELELRRHLDGCARCRDSVATLISLNDAVAGAIDVKPIPHGLRERLPIPQSDRRRSRGRSLLSAAVAIAALLSAFFCGRWLEPRGAGRLRDAAEIPSSRQKPDAAISARDRARDGMTLAGGGIFLENLLRSDQSALDLGLIGDSAGADD